jgi:hypothetical protein
LEVLKSMRWSIKAPINIGATLKGIKPSLF